MSDEENSNGVENELDYDELEENMRHRDLENRSPDDDNDNEEPNFIKVGFRLSP